MRLSLISSKHCIMKQLLDSVFVIILLLLLQLIIIIIINFIYIASIPLIVLGALQCQEKCIKIIKT